MHRPKRHVQPLIVARQTPKASGPSKGAFDHPTTRQQHKAFLRFGQFDHFQPDALLLGGLGGVLARVALIDKGDFDVLACDLLHLRG